MYGLYVCENKSGLCKELSEAISSVWYADHMFWVSLATFSAAAIAVCVAYKNFKELSKQNKYDRASKVHEARALLPTECAILKNYCIEAIFYINEYFLCSPKEVPGDSEPVEAKKPDFPAEYVRRMAKAGFYFNEDDGSRGASLEVVCLLQQVGSECSFPEKGIGLCDNDHKTKDCFSGVVAVLSAYTLLDRLSEYGSYDAVTKMWKTSKVGFTGVSQKESENFWNLVRPGPGRKRNGAKKLEEKFKDCFDLKGDEYFWSKQREYERELLSYLREQFKRASVCGERFEPCMLLGPMWVRRGGYLVSEKIEYRDVSINESIIAKMRLKPYMDQEFKYLRIIEVSSEASDFQAIFNQLLDEITIYCDKNNIIMEIEKVPSYGDGLISSLEKSGYYQLPDATFLRRNRPQR